MGFRSKRPANAKAVPYFSHEFVIQNHGDIATCICMVFIVGFMFQVTAPLASMFITPTYNITEMVNDTKTPVLYTYGPKDISLVFFYTITAIILHAIIQEYILDRFVKKVRLSKTKSSKFNESGQLFSFYLISIVWCAFIFKNEGYFQTLNFFWTGYPHVGMTFLTKFFFIIQMSYWAHILPELYLQRVKKEEQSEKFLFAAIHFFICAGIYLLNFSRIGITLLFIDYSMNALFHLSRILHFSGKAKFARLSFRIYNVLFVLARSAAILLSIFVFWFGFQSVSVDSVNWEEKNFNTKPVRAVCLGVAVALQAWMLWNFIIFQCKKIRENSKTSSTKVHTKQQPTRKAKSAGSDSFTDGDSDAPVVNGDLKAKKAH